MDNYRGLTRGGETVTDGIEFGRFQGFEENEIDDFVTM